MDMTALAIIASLAMGLGAAFLFIYAVKQDWFRDIEDTKYQVFWSDREPPAKDTALSKGSRPEEPVNAAREAADDSQSEKN